MCVGNLTIIDSDNGLSPGRRQAIIWTNAGILLIGPLGTNPSEIVSGIQTFSFKKMHFKVSSAKWRPFCLGLDVLIEHIFSLLILTFHATLWQKAYIPSSMGVSGANARLSYWYTFHQHWSHTYMYSNNINIVIVSTIMNTGKRWLQYKKVLNFQRYTQ